MPPLGAKEKETKQHFHPRPSSLPWGYDQDSIELRSARRTYILFPIKTEALELSRLWLIHPGGISPSLLSSGGPCLRGEQYTFLCLLVALLSSNFHGMPSLHLAPRIKGDLRFMGHLSPILATIIMGMVLNNWAANWQNYIPMKAIVRPAGL